MRPKSRTFPTLGKKDLFFPNSNIQELVFMESVLVFSLRFFPPFPGSFEIDLYTGLGK